MIIRIDDPGDPRLAPYAAIRERDLAGRSGQFIAEGEVVVRRLLGESRLTAESVLLLETRLERSAELLRLADPGLPILVAPRGVIDAVAGFPLHRGVLAVGRRPEPGGAAAALAGLGPRALAVILVGLSNHDNVGGIFRNAAAFGAGLVLLDDTCCDPLYRKAIRVSVGAALTVPFAHGGSASDILREVARAGFEPLSFSPSGREDLHSVTWPERCAVVLGAEGPGLPDDILRRTRTVRIPIVPGFDSLNVATSSGIALHAWRAARERA